MGGGGKIGERKNRGDSEKRGDREKGEAEKLLKTLLEGTYNQKEKENVS